MNRQLQQHSLCLSLCTSIFKLLPVSAARTIIRYQ